MNVLECEAQLDEPIENLGLCEALVLGLPALDVKTQVANYSF